MTTSENDPLCDTGFDGYFNLEDFDIFANPVISGDGLLFAFVFNGDPFNFYGNEFDNVYFTDDGFAVFDPDANYAGESGTPQMIPSADRPNNLAAMMWQDMEIFYDAATNQGVSAATVGPDVIIVEYDNMEFPGGSDEHFDFEIVMTRSVDDTPGSYEIVFAYDNLEGILAGPLTVGVENVLGNEATALVNNADSGGVLKDGLMVCFDFAVAQTEVTISYETTVDDEATLGTKMNTVRSTTNVVGSEETTTSSGVYVGYPSFSPAIPIKQ
jgi:hypothetical protein